MKKLVFFFALLCSTSLVAQFSYYPDGTGIQSASNTASGTYSTAMGISTTASGDVSTAMGISTTASGDYSTAMGSGTTSSGDYSTAMGSETIASGNVSTAMGIATTAQDYGTIAIGLFNETKETPNPDSFSYQNTAFVIGNGGFDNEGNWLGGADETRSNAFEILFDGSTTIAGNVTAPAFIGDGSQLTNLPTPTVNYGDITNVPLSYNENNQAGIQSLNNTASGSYSTAMGLNTTASGDYSTSLGQSTTASGFASTTMGQVTTASGDWSTAMGKRTQASGDYSTAMGELTEASGSISTAMGWGTLASGGASIAMGYNTTASGDNSTAMGEETIASGYVSTALGYQTNASGNQSIAIGWRTNSNGDVSTAIGAATNTEDYISFAIGTYNKTDETPNPTQFSYQNTAFVIGNGGFGSDGSFIGTDESRSNAFEVLFDGTTTIAGDLNINSDARLKANIISLGATLSKLLQIDGKTYTMKKDANHKKKIGLLAQDIEKVFPELVTETNDIKSVNYQGLVPVLINAMKEQDDKITKQQVEIEQLKKKQQQEIDELKAMVKQLANR